MAYASGVLETDKFAGKRVATSRNLASISNGPMTTVVATSGRTTESGFYCNKGICPNEVAFFWMIKRTCLKMPQIQRVGHVLAHANEHHFKWFVWAVKDLTQRVVDQTPAEIKHGRDCR